MLLWALFIGVLLISIYFYANPDTQTRWGNWIFQNVRRQIDLLGIVFFTASTARLTVNFSGSLWGIPFAYLVVFITYAAQWTAGTRVQAFNVITTLVPPALLLSLFQFPVMYFIRRIQRALENKKERIKQAKLARLRK